MAKKSAAIKAPKKPTATERAQAAANRDTNGINGEAAQKALAVFQEVYRKKLSIMGAAMNDCAQQQKRVVNAFAIAKENGVPVRALKAHCKLWVKDVEKENIRSKLNPDDSALLNQLETTLGALGKWAAAQARNKPEPDRVAENVAALESGISQLN